MTTTRATRLALLAALASLSCRDGAVAAGAADEAPRTTVLPAPAGGEPYEPSIAIDPAHPERVLAASMYGVPRGGGEAKGIWVWRSGDGARTWRDGRLDPPWYPGAATRPAVAADVIAGFARDGAALLATMSDLPPLGGTFLSRFSLDSAAFASVPVHRNTVDSTAGRRVLYDKPWMVVDHEARSPRRGAIYYSVSGLTTGLGPAGPAVRWTLHATNVVLAVSRDGGRTVSTPVAVADTAAFGAHLAVGPTGVLEVSYMHFRPSDKAADAVLHVRSGDGGTTFEPPVTVAATRGDTLVALPDLAVRPDGALLACWSQLVPSDERSAQVRCAARAVDGAWDAARPIEAALPAGVVPAWPTIVGTARGWYLMLYLVGAARTEVALFRSADGHRFARVATLAAVEGLGTASRCVAGVAPCARESGERFRVGDYVALDARGGRVAAAYVLPRGGSAGGEAAVWVTTLAEPRVP